ncbi:MAG: hypothetical protein HQ567_35400 [Candidatus Nealsonbacteria bacterium]|nr:hypothetical protein [Candidatus Nealsonbacteria bacterium]
MCGQIAFLAVVLGGIETGWQPLPEGGVQYLIQIDRELLESRELGQSLESYVPPHVHDVRAVRITMGTGPLPRELPVVASAEPVDKAPIAPPGDQVWSPTLPDPQPDPPAPTTDPLPAPAADPLPAPDPFAGYRSGDGGGQVG